MKYPFVGIILLFVSNLIFLIIHDKMKISSIFYKFSEKVRKFYETQERYTNIGYQESGSPSTRIVRIGRIYTDKRLEPRTERSVVPE